ncbi:MAG: hypothetical protein H6737_28340 [Alphaproteobacteria bacterium]|nr:hypothetical protein [Alphaproteobacteria bacterium]
MSPIVHGIGGSVVGMSALGEIRTASATYDAQYDPIVIRGGEVFAGPRLVHIVDGDQTILVDPDETIPDSDIHTREAIVVRRHTVVRTRPFKDEEFDVAEMQEMVSGGADIVIDSTHVAAWLDDNAALVVLGMAAFFEISTLTDWVTVPLYALAAGAIATGIVGAEKMPLRQSFAFALLVGVVSVIVGWLLWSVSLSPGCLAIPVWGTFVTLPTVGYALLRS